MSDKLDIEVALKNREFELSLFWQRSNYFLVFNTALGVAAFSARTATIGILIALFGTVVCYLWYKTNLGSRFWHVFWETEVERLAKNYQLESFMISTDEAKKRVRANVRPEKSPWWRGFIDKGVVEKPSVTVTMIYLSLAALVFWLLILIYQVSSLSPQRPAESPSALSAAPIASNSPPKK